MSQNLETSYLTLPLQFTDGNSLTQYNARHPKFY